MVASTAAGSGNTEGLARAAGTEPGQSWYAWVYAFTSAPSTVWLRPSVNAANRRLMLGPNALRVGTTAPGPPNTYQSPSHQP
jgi:hypothetical protein